MTKEERLAILLPMVEQGMSITQMHKATGQTRNAVIGLLYRAGISTKNARPAFAQDGAPTEPAWKLAARLQAEGRTNGEIATALGCSLDSVAHHLRRARKKAEASSGTRAARPVPPVCSQRPARPPKPDPVDPKHAPVRKRKAKADQVFVALARPEDEHIYARFGSQCQYIAGEPTDDQPFRCTDPRLPGKAYCNDHCVLCQAVKTGPAEQTDATPAAVQA